MPLARRVPSLDDVPEAKREDYRQEGAEWVLQVDGDSEDVSGLKKKNDELLKKNSKLQSDLKTVQDKVGDFDPEKVRVDLARLKELEEKGLLDKGEFDKVSEKRLESQRLPLEAKIRELEAALGTRDAREQELTQKLAHKTRAGDLKSAILESQVDPKWAEFIQLKAEKVWQWQQEDGSKDGVLVPMSGDEPIFVDGKQADMKTWITGVLAKERPEILLPSNGGGAAGNNGRNGGRQFYISRELAKTSQAQVERIVAEAAKAGVQPTYEE